MTAVWQPMETAPHDTRRILVAVRDSYGQARIYVAWRERRRKAWWISEERTSIHDDGSVDGGGSAAKAIKGTRFLTSVFAWQPLPDPPEVP